MRLNIIVAMSTNRVIGRDGGLPWSLPADLTHFREVTMGHPIIMGRRTYESVGRALPGRLNIVVSRQPSYAAAGGLVVASLDKAFIAAGDVEEIMIIGGAALYAETLVTASRIYLTEVHVELNGDTVFPALEPSHWKESSRELHLADARNEFDHSFVVLDRVRSY